jgi:hypothetical protein
MKEVVLPGIEAAVIAVTGAEGIPEPQPERNGMQ